MTICQVQKNEMISKLAESIGKEKATAIVDKTAISLGYGNKKEFNKNETIKILEVLQKQGGMINVIAGFMKSEVYLMPD